ncbi:MAG: hypothetical protein K0R76_299 [Alphaproteobacteria bacterium]|jgi:hypothetical protein|nr:hypothetical protein [Alphaproteobacteria bacterium]
MTKGDKSKYSAKQKREAKHNDNAHKKLRYLNTEKSGEENRSVYC